jgi:hypothetical protein
MLDDGDADALDDGDADAGPVLADVVEPPVADVELELLGLLEQLAAASEASTATETPNTAGLRPLRQRDTLHSSSV